MEINPVSRSEAYLVFLNAIEREQLNATSCLVSKHRESLEQYVSLDWMTPRTGSSSHEIH